jgi:hypothetical protein
MADIFDSLDVRVLNDIESIRDLVDQGWCPVECSVDGESVVDELEMDHHGAYSHLEAVSIRAWRDHFGARRDDSRFVIAGSADADATFAAAALAGLLPHPSRAEEVARLRPEVQERLTADIGWLAEAIALVDTEPIGIDYQTLPGGALFIVWNSFAGSGRERLSALAGIHLWRALTTGRSEKFRPYFDAAHQVEQARVEDAMRDLDERGVELDGALVIYNSRVFGFSEWYGRDESSGPYDSPSGWRHPVVLSWVEGRGQVTVGCPNIAVAEALFGEGGLKNLFSRLEPQGWGGREAVGGSPRGLALTRAQVEDAARVIASAVIQS